MCASDLAAADRRIAQASGMVSVQAECTVEEALVRIEECAQSMSQSVRQVADAVVERRLRFAPTK